MAETNVFDNLSHDFTLDSLWPDFDTQLETYGRPPEKEIYGRSLTTIRRLGAFMIGKLQKEVVTSPEAAQARVEFYTSVEEGFGTDMELGGGLEVRDFDVRPIINGKVMAKDNKTAVSSMTDAGLKCAVKTAKEDSWFRPQLARSYWDHDNALTVDEMARRETAYNTRIVVSPFPEEAAAVSGDAYWRNIGYVPHLRRGFVQLYHVTDQKTVIAGSLSFDGSNKQKLQEVFKAHGIDVPDGEVTDNWLRYALTATMNEDQAKEFAISLADELDQSPEKTTNTVDVTGEYQQVMDAVFDDSYIHVCESLSRGRQTARLVGLVHELANKAHYFNERYATALYNMRANPNQFTDDDSIVLHELLVYSTIEMMRALHLEKSAETRRYVDGSNAAVAFILQSGDPTQLQNMLSSYAAEGAKQNRVYSACGLEISVGGQPGGDGPQTAYGGVDRSEESSGKKFMKCPFCRAVVYGDPCAKVLSCWDCSAKVVKGIVVSKGNGGSKARAAAEAKKRKEQEAAMAKQVEEVVSKEKVAASVAEEKARAPQQVGQLALAGV